MKLNKFVLIFISLLNIFLLMNCSKDDNITEPETDITEDEHLKIASKKIGLNGGTIDFGDGTILSIPENALTSEVEVSISKIKNAPSFSQYGIETFRLEPSGINLNKSVTLQTKYEEYQDFGEDLISVITYSQSKGIWERLNIIEQDQSQNMIKVEIDHFSWFKTIFDRPLDLVMEIPGEYLKKGDLIYVMTWEEYLWGADKTFDWFPGHAGLYLGTKDESSFTNDNSTTIESSPWDDKPDGVQFSDFNHFKSVFYHLYMGARRYDGTISNDDRTKIATYAIDKKNHGYSKIGEGNIVEGKYSCVGLTEASYDYADKDIISAISEFPFILPIEQYIQTVPVNEIKVKSNMEVNVPVKGVVRDKTKKEYTDNPSKFTINASNIPSGATFSNDTLSWIPDQSNVGNRYTVNFTVSAVVGDMSYSRYQDLKITVEQGPISNTQPNALFIVNPTTGTISTVFNFDASGCTDNEDTSSDLKVRWDWENDSSWDTNYSTIKSASHQYSTQGTKTINMEVKDTEGLTNSTTRQVSVSNGSGETGTVTDIEGNTYKTIKIGNQWWMAENLNVTHYRNGDTIPNVTNSSDWQNLTTGTYCNYNNDASNADTYGRLYNWYAVNDSRKIAPIGWHVPTDEDWKTLEKYLGMSQSEANGTSFRGTNEGGKLKETGTIHWQSPNKGATNESGFSALPGGYRDHDGIYYTIGRIADFWSSTVTGSYAWNRYVTYNNSGVSRNNAHKRGGFSVRCVKD